VTLAGHVVDAVSRAPVRGAHVTLTLVVDTPHGTFGRRPRQALTTADGAFAFEGVEPGQYTTNVEK
jgi:hypothetical protein